MRACEDPGTGGLNEGWELPIFSGKIGFHALECGFITRETQKIGLALRFEQDSQWDYGICELEQWDFTWDLDTDSIKLQSECNLFKLSQKFKKITTPIPIS